MGVIKFPKSKAEGYALRLRSAESYEEVLNVIKELEEDVRKSKRADLVLVLLQAYILAGMADEAIEVVNKAEPYMENDPNLYIHLIDLKANALIHKRLLREAVRELEKAIGKFPADKFPSVNKLKALKVVSLVNLGDFPSALEALNEMGKDVFLDNVTPEVGLMIIERIHSFEQAKSHLEENKDYRQAYEELKEIASFSEGVYPYAFIEGDHLRYGFVVNMQESDAGRIVEKEIELFNRLMGRTGRPYVVMVNPV
ncbi:hypothetical protein [Hydrogenivirga sp. 128-5-R1-1]|uniref:hypothetical protein n=1 Tax=Hydrogenivirga sp. 128-5-R1-1 TaxID=392423 RepID=UPI00015F18AA|nr:hypothetical protein [Hydrogenivirga sp. 128-5-R1-1]EDP75395.1 hypothetical protein HG1285_15561 [Hydrogenivirga sp. 128-5-R1-1]